MCSNNVIYLDLDDTVKETERYIRRVISSNGIRLKPNFYGKNCDSVYLYVGSDTREGMIVTECLKNWNIIPFKASAINSIKLLKTEYEIIFCTAYCFGEEAEWKKAFAKSMGCNIILCGEECMLKDSVDMQGCIFVDDRHDILLRSNAEDRYELFNPYYFDFHGYVEREDNIGLVDWYSLVDTLMGKCDKSEGGRDFENIRGMLCQGVQA